MNPSEVHRYVCAAFDEFVRKQLAGTTTQSWNVVRADLLAWVKRLDESIAFAGLLSILESEQRYQYQDIAGDLLDTAAIKCPLSLEEFLRRVLPVWNVSAMTVPRYAARVFGREAVLSAAQNLKARGVSWAGRGTLDGMQYCLGLHPDNV